MLMFISFRVIVAERVELGSLASSSSYPISLYRKIQNM